MKKKPYEKLEIPKTRMPYLDKNQPILMLGTLVRVILHKPRGYTGEALHGTFRATDIRWNPKHSKVTNVIVTPNQPIMYQVDGLKTGYTYNQLQVIKTKTK